jgi:hypothetical protein
MKSPFKTRIVAVHPGRVEIEVTLDATGLALMACRDPDIAAAIPDPKARWGAMWSRARRALR